MSEVSERARAAWSAGDWPELSKLVVDAGMRTVERAGVRPGQQVLDVGAGDGNVAIPAAQAGGRVTALDPTPELFESGRTRAAEAGVEIEWVEGEASALPYEDGAFDAVLSNFGAMFAPDHARTAAELARVCAPGGVIVMTAWAADHMLGRLFLTIAPYLGPPPEGAQPPFLWGDEDHARECFAPTGREVTVERDVSPLEFPSLDDYVDFLSATLGPIALNRPRLEREGTYETLREAMRALFSEYGEPGAATWRAAPEYLAISLR